MKTRGFSEEFREWIPNIDAAIFVKVILKSIHLKRNKNYLVKKKRCGAQVKYNLLFLNICHKRLKIGNSAFKSINKSMIYLILIIYIVHIRNSYSLFT